MKTKQHLLFIAFFLYTIGSFSQVVTHALFHQNTINAAYAGSDEYFHLGANYRFIAEGIEGAPRTLLFNMHTPVYKGVGVGLSYVNDRIGFADSNTTSIDISYKYQIDKKNQISIGVKGINYSTSLSIYNNSEINDIDDPQVLADTNFSVALFYKTNRFYVGLAATNLLKEKSFFTSLETYNPVFIANSGYSIDISDDMILKPSVTFFMNDSSFSYIIAGELYLYNFETSYYYSNNNLFGMGLMSPTLFKTLKLGFNYEYQRAVFGYYSNSIYNFIAKFEVKDLLKGAKD